MPTEEKKIITIGIDSSTTACGIAVYENGVFVDTTLFKFPGTYSLDKLQKIITDIDQLFDIHNPDIVLIEEAVPIRNSKAVTSLNQVFGAIVSLAMLSGAWVNQVHNKVCKKTFSYKTKADAMVKAKELTGAVAISEHEADAILIVETYKKMIEPAVEEKGGKKE